MPGLNIHGAPSMVDEGPDCSSFRVGLFGLDKLRDVEGAAARPERALDQVF